MRDESAPSTSSSRKRRADSGPRLTGWRKDLWDWCKALIIAIAVVLLLRAFVFQLSTVRMHSMQPTLYEKEWLFINKISYRFGHPERGDVVILKDPSEGPDRKDYLVKRVVGVPGDRLEIRSGQLYINGELTVEPYTDTAIEDGNFGPAQVSAGHYFVMGDNRHRSASRDSREFKEVPEEMIIGKAEFIMWPIVRWAKL